MWRRRRAPTFSIVVATLDRWESLRRTLDGLARQTYRSFEVVVVNGPGSDGAAELLAEYPVRVGATSELNVSRSRNTGARMAAGDVVVFVDDDAIPEPGWLEELAGAHADAGVAAAGGPVFDVPLGRVEWAICTCTREGSVETRSTPPVSRYVGRGADPFLFFAGCNLSVRRSELRRAGGFDPAIPYCYEDAELCMRIVDADARLEWVEGALVRHERAPSHIRDGEQVIQDPYSLMVSVAAFVERSAPMRAPSVLDAWLEGWCTSQAEQVPEGQRAWFRERVAQGIGDGRAAGRRPREHVELGPQSRDDFRPFG